MDRYELIRMARIAGVNVGAKTIGNLEAFAILVVQSAKQDSDRCIERILPVLDAAASGKLLPAAAGDLASELRAALTQQAQG